VGVIWNSAQVHVFNEVAILETLFHLKNVDKNIEEVKAQIAAVLASA